MRCGGPRKNSHACERTIATGVDFSENKKGSPEPGKFADLVVWHDNPYTVATEDILELTSDLTMVGGKVVHQV